MINWRKLCHHLCGGVDWNSCCGRIRKCYWVTTFAVVWIEIKPLPVFHIKTWLSPPLRWCGLKSINIPEFDRQIDVTTFAVVWIEIFKYGVVSFAVTSPPLRWCGLKSCVSQLYFGIHKSPPLRWCGLKYICWLTNNPPAGVTTFAVVWIEISVQAVI